MTNTKTLWLALAQALLCACGSAEVLGTPAQTITVTVEPGQATLERGATQAFSAAVTGTANTVVTWSVTEGAAGGSISAAGLYQAPQATGTYHVVATSQIDSTKSAGAVVTVQSVVPVVTVSVVPTSVTVAPGGSQAFTATVTNVTDPSVTWSITEGAAGGTISASGVYTAPGTAGTYHVVARSVESGAAMATATVRVGTVYALPADRATTWKPGVSYNGGIPERPQCGSTLIPRGGTLDDTASIQSAISACPAGQMVRLGPGTFRLSNPGILMKSSVTLRGAGPDQTTLHQTGTEPCVRFGPGWWPDGATKWGGTINLATDAVKGQMSVTLASTTGAVVGEIVHVNETYDSGLTWFAPDRQTSDYLGWGEGRKGTPAASRPIGQAMQIASVSGSTVTFSTPFHQTYRVSKTAHMARPTSGSLPYATVRGAGVEDLSVTGGSAGDGWGNIVFYVASGCWAKHIESSGSDVALIGSFRCEVRDSYIHTAGSPNPGGGGYGIVVDTYSADNLIENNIVWSFNKVMVMRASGGGNVIGYNYMEDAYGQGYPTLMETGINASHMTTPHHELFEGNQAINADSDSTWGNSIYITFFRNHLTGLRRNIQRPGGPVVQLSDAGNKRCAGLTLNHWWYSFVGNVLGYPTGYLQAPSIGFAYPNLMSPGPQGKSFHYEWVGGPHGGSSSPSWTPVWQLGYDGANWVTTPDSVVISRLLRDANYDYFTNQQKWHGVGGVATDPVTGAGAATPPAVNTLPDSLYLESRPAFFGFNAWPWVDPSTGGLGVLPARRRFDAGTPNDITP